MHLRDEHVLPGHRREKTVQAIDHDKARAVFDSRTDLTDELARGKLGRIKLRDLDHSRLYVAAEVDAKLSGPLVDGGEGFVKIKNSGHFVAFRGGFRISGDDRRLAAAGGADDESAGAVGNA